MTTEKSKRAWPLPVWIVLAMALGVLVGPLLGSSAVGLGLLGTVTIQLIKAIATPLLFLAIVRALSTTDVRASWLGRMAAIALFNVTIALGIGLLTSNLLRPGAGMELKQPLAVGDYAQKQLDLVKTVEALVPTDLVSPFLKNSVLSVVILALLFGFALRVASSEGLEGAARAGAESLKGLVEGCFRVCELALGWTLKLIPLAVFGVVAKTVAEHGLAPLRGLSLYLAAGVIGLTIHVLVTYQLWLVLYAKLGLRRFWRAARAPISVAWGTNSSLATLPVTLHALDELGVSPEASALGACVGTNLNNDGIVLYEGMAVLWVAQASGLDLSLGQQALAALICVVAAMGVAGVPEAGFVSLAIVLNAVGLPLELLPLMLTVDWVIARGRSVVNVLSDMVLSIVLDRFNLGRQPLVPVTIPPPD